MGKHEKHLHINIEDFFLFLPDYAVINDSWFLILTMNGYLTTCFYTFHVLEKQKLIKTNRHTDRVTWVREVKSYENDN